jgi:hypothetical protein
MKNLSLLLQSAPEEATVAMHGIPWCIAVTSDGTILAGADVGDVWCLYYSTIS